MTQNNNYQIFLIDSITGSTGNYATLDCEGIDLTNTFQVADIADISKRKDAISKTITFKNSKNNALVFGNLSNLNRVVDDTVNLSFLFNFNITKDIDCQVYEGNTLIFVGKLHFISAYRDKLGNITYQCSIKGYLVDFFNKIQDKLLSDLDFTTFNHTYDMATIKNSWFNVYQKNGVTVTGTTGQGYVYPLIDYGTSVTPDTAFDNKIDYGSFRPALYLKEYFNAIFNQSGVTGNYRYTVTGSTEFVDEFNKAIMPNGDSDFSYSRTPGVIFELAKTINPQQYNANGQTSYDSVHSRNEFNNLVIFDTIVSGAGDQTIINPILADDTKITINNKINTTITATANVVTSLVAGNKANVRCVFEYRSDPNGQFESIGESNKNYTWDYSKPLFTYQFHPDTFTVSFTHQFDAGGQLALLIFIDNYDNDSNVTVNVINADLKIGSAVASSTVTLNLGDTAVLVGQNSQKIKQADFLKSVIQMFNLYVYPDPEDAHNIIFTPYNDYYSNFTAANIINTALDWTNKIDNASFTQTPVSDIFNLYTFKFKQDSDFYSKYYIDKYGDTYGNLTITGTTNGSDKSIELIFGSTPVASYNGRNVPWLWELNTDNTKKAKVTVPRILFYNGLVNCPSYEIGKIQLSAATQTYYFSSIDSAHVSGYTFNQYAEANEYTLSSNNEFVDLTFGQPLEVFYTSGGILNNFGSGKKTLYDRYYADQFAELQDSNTRIIETTAYLNEVDIQNLDFRKPVYFNSVLGHNYFKLLSVEYSNSNQPSTIKLQTAYINDSAVVSDGFWNDIYATFVRKNDCTTSGYTGEALYYLVSAHKYNSLVSVADANAMAANEAATSGQTYANANGICVNTATTFSLGFANNPTVATSMTGKTNFVTSTGTLNSGATIFSYAGGDATRNISAYYGNDTYWYQTNTLSTIINSGTTASLTGMTYDDYYLSGSTKYLSCQVANDGHTTYINYKISDPTPRIGTVVKDSTGTSLVADGWYSDGTNGYSVVSGAIADIQSCRGLPPTIS
ncbi:DUF5977 domain-containing protein [Mucilaginibacter ginsenosidivorax]|uniref:DUF5977 domain-containing protein n=1 Tax=Mucilaginibacter ginsenosidivorax TaxID=862126 RepID=A0A5B8W756_9SPHI|nr:DUF5977 domain-containing protein [Mucilaginibacter ginsenosidivorax]QEC78765.1 hypothetical protein FSB76_23475 [Mucilaginibacter ginsenosidivorax]